MLEEVGSPALNELVEAALARNPGLDAAKATLKEARSNMQAAQGIFYPRVSLGLSAERLKQAGASNGGVFTPPLFNLYTGEVSVSYDPNVFGLNRLVSRNEQAQVDVAADQLQAARLTLAGNAEIGQAVPAEAAAGARYPEAQLQHMDSERRAR